MTVPVSSTNSESGSLGRSGHIKPEPERDPLGLAGGGDQSPSAGDRGDRPGVGGRCWCGRPPPAASRGRLPARSAPARPCGSGGRGADPTEAAGSASVGWRAGSGAPGDRWAGASARPIRAVDAAVLDAGNHPASRRRPDRGGAGGWQNRSAAMNGEVRGRSPCGRDLRGGRKSMPAPGSMSGPGSSRSVTCCRTPTPVGFHQGENGAIRGLRVRSAVVEALRPLIWRCPCGEPQTSGSAREDDDSVGTEVVGFGELDCGASTMAPVQDRSCAKVLVETKISPARVGGRQLVMGVEWHEPIRLSGGREGVARVNFRTLVSGRLER